MGKQSGLWELVQYNKSGRKLDQFPLTNKDRQANVKCELMFEKDVGSGLRIQSTRVNGSNTAVWYVLFPRRPFFGGRYTEITDDMTGEKFDHPESHGKTLLEDLQRIRKRDSTF